MKNLSSKIILHNLILIGVCTALISLFNIYHNRETLLETKFQETENKVQIFSSNIQSKIDELKNDTLFLSSTPPIQGILRATQNGGKDSQENSSLEQWKNRLEIIFREMLIAKEHYLQIRYIGVAQDGLEILRVDRKGSRIFRVSDENLQAKGNRKYFQEALQVGQHNIYLSDFDLNMERGQVSLPHQMVLRAAVPVYKKIEKPFGIIIINMDYTNIFKSFSQKNLNFENFFVTDSQDRILLHSNENFKNISNDGKFLPLNKIYPEIAKQLSQKEEKNVVQSKIEAHKLLVFTKVQYDELSSKHFLNLVTESDLGPINQRVFESLKNDIFFLLSLIFLGLTLTFFYIRKLVSPIKKLKELADDVYHNRPIEIDPESIKSEDEIGALSRSLITMSKELIEKNFILKFQTDAIDKSAIVAETDAKGKITYVNDKFCEISGYAREELIGKDHRLLNSGEHSKDFFRKMWDTINSGNIWRGEIKNKTKSGLYYWVDSSIVPFVGTDGKIQKFVAIRHDITYQKEQEKNLQGLAQAKADFLATMSHEIRTPLNAIVSMPDLLADENLSSEGQEYIKTMRSSAESLKVLIDDILDFSKIEAGKLALECKDLSLQDLVNDTITMFKSNAHEKGLELKSSLPSELPTFIKSDITRLKQVLSNLVSNAIKFTQSGYVEISAEVKRKDGTQYLIQFNVKDTGIGISQEAQKSLFQSFQQADNSTSRKFGGTGLGLAICKGICKALNGDIWIESKPNEGSIFHFTFKCTLGHEVKKTDSEIVITEQVANILVVDDNKTNQMILNRFLSKLGHKITVVDSGHDALRLSRENHFDVVYMDCQMPEMDGYEATSLIRKILPLNQQPWIIACTASEGAEQRKRCLNAGMDDFVSKPLTLKSVSMTMKKYFDQAKQDPKKNVA